MTSIAPERSHPNVTLATLALAGLAFALLQSLVSPALPTIQHDLGASASGATWILTAYLLSAGVATPILGRLGDIHGKRRIIIVALVGLAAGTFLAAIAQTIGLLIAARVIQGIGGGIFPLAFGIIRDEFPREKVAGSIGLMSALLGLGAGVGIVLAGVIVEHLDYHWLFWLPLIGILVALAGVVRFVPESPYRAPGRVDWLSAALMAVGLSAILLAVSETTTWGWGSAKTLGLLAAGLAVCAVWVLAELHTEHPLVDMRVMAIRGVWTTNLVAALLGAGMFCSFVLVPQFTETPKATGFGYGASVIGAGLFLLPSAVLMLVFGSVAGALERRVGSKPPVVAGAAFALASFVVLLAGHDTKALVYVACGLLGIGVGLAFAAMANLIVGAVSPEQTGVATGMNTVARSLGGAFGGQIAATFIADSVTPRGLPTIEGFDHGFMVAIIALALAVLAALLIPTTSRRRRDRIPSHDAALQAA
ncbi:MAG: hypothetical protein QOK21_3123 [Solirubrobacteraceae bacterium]|jgi:EmrB/QacA subfamily drug resistance transporter|nr:hypothetical protein [Solirubrobacteraceae bacterium]